MIKTRGIIIHKTNFGESSLIVKAYTKDLGIKSYIVHGIRKKKPKYNAVLFFPLSLVDLVVYNSKKKNINHIKDIKSAINCYKIFSIPSKSTVAFMICEVILKTSVEEDRNEKLFSFLTETIKKLEIVEKEDLKLFVINFLLKYSHFIGFGITSTDNISSTLKQNKFDSLTQLQKESISLILCNKYIRNERFEKSDVIEKILNLFKSNLSINFEILSLNISLSII